ncbi:lipocalin/fatty-acid binding family protein [Streptomyces sp. NBC_00239]|uniref:lipocalin/fatty-acid binding family protein n=1 Tax=Streptomyces sp. NBC_00239 TaxID=2903640 RepID=UPI002E2E1238|nr:lipocalin/fatty-acid binding family protein [Streptomyces sp. NBC_00239]
MAIEGTWEMISSDNYGEYLKAAGVGLIQRNALEKSSMTEELASADGRWELSVRTQVKTTKVSFTLGVDFETVAADGRTVTACFTRDGDTLVEVQEIGGERVQVFRKYGPSEMTAAYSAKGVTATRVFKRL